MAVADTETPATVSRGDFISTYAYFADVYEVPRKSHEWIAIQLIASAMNGRVQIPHGAITYPLDLWVLLLSESGQGRNTITDVALDVIAAAHIDEELIRKPMWGSKQAFYQQLATLPYGLYVWQELSVVHSIFNDPKFAGLKPFVTDRYDNLKLPAAITYRDTGRKSDTPPIIFSEVPRMNILATSSHDWFVGSLKQADTLGGYIPRWLLVDVGRTNRLVPKPLPRNQSLVPTLSAHLKAIYELRGKADLSDIDAMHATWYKAAHARFRSGPNAALAAPFFNRLRGQILKLAVIFQVSENVTLKISPQAMQRAIDAAIEIETGLFEILQTGMSQEGAEVGRIERLIRDAGPVGLTRSKLTRATQNMKHRELDERLITLRNAAAFCYFGRSTGGRPCVVLVHADHFAEHHKLFSQDTPMGNDGRQ